MNRSDKIYVAGHRGLAGGALMRRLQAGGFNNLVTRTHAELDLTDSTAVHGFFADERIAGALPADLDKNLSTHEVGLAVNGGRHPLPQRYDLQLQWLAQLTAQITDLSLA